MKTEERKDGGFNTVGTPEEHQRLLNGLKKGDKRCKLSIGTEVEKIDSQEKDHTKDGTKGKIIGSVQIDKQDAYLVQFEGSGSYTFIMGRKLKEIK